MNRILEAVEQSKNMLVDYVPHSLALGFVVVDAKPGETWLKVPWTEKFIGNPQSGVLHGGVITTVLDNCAGVSVATALAEMRAIATLDLRIDYMKPATPGRDVIGWSVATRSAATSPSCAAPPTTTIPTTRSRPPR